MTPALIVLAGAVLGTVIGMLGGGGGVLAVPLLLALGEPALSASTMSLAVVGTGAAAALVPHHRAGRVEWRLGLIFGALGSVGAVVGARAAHLIPETALVIGFAGLVLLGAGAMLSAGRTAWRAEHLPEDHVRDESGALLDAGAVRGPGKVQPRPRIGARVVALASGVGLVTGVFGVGAGFVVVPALVAALRVPVKKATATALVVIVMNSAVALAAKYDALRDVRATLELAAATAVFAVVGAILSRRVPAWILSTAFGVLMVGVAIATLVHGLTL